MDSIDISLRATTTRFLARDNSTVRRLACFRQNHPSRAIFRALDMRAAPSQRSETADDSPVVAAVDPSVSRSHAVLVGLMQRRQGRGRVHQRHASRRRQLQQKVVG